LVADFEAKAGTGTSNKSFIMSHRFELLSFLNEQDMGVMMAAGEHIEKHRVLEKHWESCAIVRALFQGEKADAYYADYRKHVKQIVADAYVDRKICVKSTAAAMEQCKQKARELCAGGSFWWKSGIQAHIEYFGNDTTIQFNDVTMEYKLRFAAIEKVIMMESGELPPFTWDDAFRLQKKPYDADQVAHGQSYLPPYQPCLIIH
jgi:hypothetical protein